MATMAENVIAAGAENRPPMLEKGMYDSWKSHILLYIEGQVRGRSGWSLVQVPSTPCAHDAACSFFAQPTTSPQLENKDFQQIDEDDLEELDLRWQVAMLTIRVRKFIQKTGRNMDFKEKRHVSLDKSKIECYNYHRKGHFARECRSRRNQGKRSYDEQWQEQYQQMNLHHRHCEREKHSRARLEILGYELALEPKSRILGHEKNELAWGEKYEFQNYELKCREIKINNLNTELEKVVKERDELKLKIEKWEESSKNLDELLNNQMSARDKTGLGYGTQLNEMSNNSETDSEISLSVFDVRSSDEESTPANDRDKVIIEDWNSDDEDDVSEVQTVSPVKTNETQTVKTRVDKIDYDFHDKQSQEPKLKTVGNTGPRVDKPVWDNTKRVNHQKFSKYPQLRKTFVPSGVLKRTVSTPRPVSTARPISTVRPFAPKIAQTSSAIRPIYPRMDNGAIQDLVARIMQWWIVGCSSHYDWQQSYLSKL
ncbi:ribonuclease H-like domain-containing protein [Tanacetum coccineum]